jgi:hypothetical protein
VARCTKQERELLDALKEASVVTPSPYKSNEGELQVYRMRLFTPRQRQVLRNGLRGEHSYECIEGGAGMMDELEMVNFEAHGTSVSEIKRQI